MTDQKYLAMTLARKSEKQGFWKSPEVNNSLRNYSNLRFTIFTVYLAALGGLLSIAFGLFPNPGNSCCIKMTGRIGGLLVTLLFFCYELRIQSLIDHSLKTGKELEWALGYNHIIGRPSWRFRSSYATNCFFALLIVSWAISIVLFLPSLVKGIIAFLILHAAF